MLRVVRLGTATLRMVCRQESVRWRCHGSSAGRVGRPFLIHKPSPLPVPARVMCSGSAKKEVEVEAAGKSSEDLLEGEKVVCSEGEGDLFKQGRARDYSEKYGFLVYEAQKSTIGKVVKLLAMFNSSVLLLAQPLIVIKMEMAAWPLLVQVLYGVAVSCFVGQIIPIHALTRRYPTAIYLDYDTRIFTALIPNFLSVEKRWQFHADDIVKAGTMFTTARTMALHLDSGKKKRIPLMCPAGYFVDRDAYIIFMGYDRELDLSYQYEPDVAQDAGSSDDGRQMERLGEVKEAEFEEEIQRLNMEFARGLDSAGKEIGTENVKLSDIDEMIRKEQESPIEKELENIKMVLQQEEGAEKGTLREESREVNKMPASSVK